MGSRFSLATWAMLLGCLVQVGCPDGKGGNQDDAADAAVTTDGGSHADAAVSTDGGGHQDGGAGDSGSTDGGFTWPVPTEDIHITPHASWKNRITAEDPFIVGPQTDTPNTVRWVKFSVLMRDPTKVYFQDSHAYEFHHDFAKERLDPFLGISADRFDQVALHEQGQELILGAVLFPGVRSIQEVGIQLVRQDAFHPEMARIVLALVRNGLELSTSTQTFYMPTFEQFPSAKEHEQFFTANQFPLATTNRWMSGNGCYVGGWALGRLVQVAPGDLATAYANGTLKPTDILMLDAVPAEVPYVAGILSLSPSTPNSHVAILAQSWNIPFGYVRDEAQQSQWRALVGKEVVVRVDVSFSTCTLRMVDVDGQLTAAHRQEILALKRPHPINLPPLTALGSISANVDTLLPANITHFGGKAANYGLLRTTIADHVRPGIGFSFDLWSAFMDQTLPSTGQTLRASIAAKLSRHTYPPNGAAVQEDLETITDWIKGEATFTAAQQGAILAALSSLPSDQKLRFRSSTNVEDSDSFTGAGLYESFSGCVADDTDNDTTGPCHCDASETNERGVFRALKRVFASFYNENAFLERLRHGVDESRAAMGVLVHRTFMDEDELANGVATVTVNGVFKSIKLVSQKGAMSVTNPEGGALPEVVEVYVSATSVDPTLKQSSTLVVLGDTVMDWDQDYKDLAGLIDRVVQRWASVTGATPPFALDLEYKKVTGEGLVLRQVRPLPLPSTTKDITTFLLPQRTTRCVFQGEAEDVFSNHRLKSVWRLTTEGRFLRAADLATTFYSHFSVDHLAGNAVRTLEGDPSTLAGSGFVLQDHATVDRLDLDAQRHAELSTSLVRLVSQEESPLLTLDDGTLFLKVTHDTPVVGLDMDNQPVMRREDSVVLDACAHTQPADPADQPVNHRVNGARGLELDINFFYPPLPSEWGAGYTNPLKRWDVTTIRGLTQEPIALRGFYSQTFRAGHHNGTEEFIFEPRLEPGISAATLSELAAQDVVAIYVMTGLAEVDIRVMGTDGTLRTWH